MNIKRIFLFMLLGFIYCDISMATCGWLCCSSSGTAGEFCHNTTSSECPAGCFCPGKGGYTAYTYGVVESWCKERTGLNSGGLNDDGTILASCVHLCPVNFPNSDIGAKSVDDCYVSVGSKKLYYKKQDCETGKYLPINSGSCVSCKTGERDYCPGIKDVYPSTKGDQGLKECGSGQKANSTHTACEANGITCLDGTYLPANSSKCAACPDGYYCKEGTYSQQPIDQGNERCTGSMVPNEKRTECIQGAITVSEGYYLPANATEPVICKDAKSYCPGGKFDKAQKDQGIFDCPNGARANKNKSACTMTFTQEQMQECWMYSGSKSDYIDCLFKNNKVQTDSGNE